MKKEKICWVWNWVVESPGEEDVSEQGVLGESWNRENQLGQELEQRKLSRSKRVLG